jgi:hypothetical protein
MKEYTIKKYKVSYWQYSTSNYDPCGRSDADCFEKTFTDKKEAQEYLEHIRKNTNGLMRLTFTTTTEKVSTIIER